MSDIITGNRAKAGDFINKATANAVPSADEGRVVKLEATGRIDKQFLDLPMVLSGDVLATDAGQMYSYYTDNYLVHIGSVSSVVYVYPPNEEPAALAMSDIPWTGTKSAAYGMVVLGGYLYIKVKNTTPSPDEHRIYRYDLADLTAAPINMTLVGQTHAAADAITTLVCDGEYFYITYDAGNSVNAHVLAKYSLSGTTLTYISTITCGAEVVSWAGVGINKNGDIYVKVTNYLYKYNSSGALQYVSAASITNKLNIMNVLGTLYFLSGDTKFWSKVLPK